MVLVQSKPFVLVAIWLGWFIHQFSSTASTTLVLASTIEAPLAQRRHRRIMSKKASLRPGKGGRQRVRNDEIESHKMQSKISKKEISASSSFGKSMRVRRYYKGGMQTMHTQKSTKKKRRYFKMWMNQGKGKGFMKMPTSRPSNNNNMSSSSPTLTPADGAPADPTLPPVMEPITASPTLQPAAIVEDLSPMPTTASPVTTAPGPSPPFGNGTWQLRGNDRIDQIAAGFALAMSANGNIVAIAGQDNLVYVVQWNDGTNTWDAMGSSPVPGPEFDLQTSIALSDSGMILAVVGPGSSFDFGPIQIYQFVNGEWEPLGQFAEDPFSSTSCQLTGISVDISGNGRRVAVASPRGCGLGAEVIVQVYDLQDDNLLWLPLSSPIGLPSFVSPSAMPSRVAMSADGSTLSINYPGFDADNPSETGIYIDQDGSWSETNRISTQIDEFYARGTAFSDNGDRVVVADKRFADGVTRVQTFQELDDLTWTKLGDDLVDAGNCCAWYTYENSVALSSDGNVLIYGNAGYGLDGNSAFQGSARIYEWIDSNQEWSLVGSLFGTEADQPQGSSEIWYGYSTDISADGRTIAIAAPLAGYVEVYDYVVM